MIKKILVVVLVISTSISYAQEGTSSPYSFYGVGIQKFKGTVENRTMGGLSILTDSIHLNLQNPAAYGALKLTTYALGASYTGLNLDNAAGGDSYKDNASLNYLAIGIPAKIFGFGFGVVPLNSVGYRTISIAQDGSQSQFSGNGGLNKVYLAAGIEVTKNLSLGIDFNYNFGNIENKAILRKPNVQFDTRELRNSDLSGISFTFGATYKKMLTDKLQLTATAVSTPSFSLKSENNLQLATVILQANGREIVVESQDVAVEDRDLDLPSEFKFGLGIGATRKWFVGTEFGYVDTQVFENRFATVDDVKYEPASQYRLGGYYIPNYNSLTSYLSRIVYRGGIRYEETGLNINGQSINEFGISFGVGLPVGNLFSNANLGFEFGTRGTTDAGLVKEEFFNISLGLSLNDKWFRQIKFN